MDVVEAATLILGLKWPESMFYRCCLEAGYRGPACEDRARQLYEQWRRGSYLPNFVYSFIQFTIDHASAEVFEKARQDLDKKHLTG